MPTRATGADERRELVANSAIRIIARDGLRALTHRAVDQEAGIPQGSTSHHARTRLALLELVVDALAERAIADAKHAADALSATPQSEHQLSITELAGVVAALVERLSDRRDDMKARYALILETDDVPLLQGKLTTQSEVHAITREVTSSLLASAGLPNSDERIEELIALTDSLVFTRTVIHATTPLESILTAYLRGVAPAPTTSTGKS
ncbi:TetR family transcriptional regulator [Prescottella agglutinans]|uniref:TetR family transcriptional regulator n=1 Tax=Prescottella agglutinans TaxID=1644129 RepID=A0A3S3CZM8_9NOCA|nr:TetR/AcrR family transcriptional regulator [Prescottella agglutinans]RVW09550.1 TetR family transcriptional regulator [Prescottella agglutinans]